MSCSINVSGVIFFPHEPKKQRSKRKITPDLRLAVSCQAIPEGDAFTRVTVYFCFFLSISRSLANTLHIALGKCLGAAGTLRLPLLMPYRCIAPGEKDILNFPLIYNHSKVPQGN